MVESIQNSFDGGLNTRVDSTKLPAGSYRLLVNGRVRSNAITPVKLPVKLTELPAGKVQGLFGFDSYLLAVIDGLIYYKNFVVDDSFQIIHNVLVDANVDQVWMEAVSAAYMNLKRTLASETSKDAINLTDSIHGSQAGIVIQDGVNQPRIITSDGARELQSYAQWTQASREYVPIGGPMLFDSGKLYILSKDSNGNFTFILHSVTGRPIDFMVNIDSSGDKATDESEGGAKSVSHSVTFNNITAINRLSTSGGGGFFVGSLGGSWIVLPDFENTLFGEPTFRNIPLFTTGPLNPFSLVDINGDSAFIDQRGIKSFNSIEQTNNTSNNTPFSADISPLFQNILQETCCAISFDEYAHFAVNTIHGPAIVIYDALSGKFVGLDIFPGVGQVKQFAEIKVAGENRLFFCTVDDEIYEAYAGSNATCRFYFGDISSGIAKTQIKTGKVYLSFDEIKSGGYVQVTSFVDKREVSRDVQVLETPEVDSSTPASLPFNHTNSKASQQLAFNFSLDAELGWKLGYFIEWDCEASLSVAYAVSETYGSPVPHGQKVS